jgi:hypothetical protein
MMSQELLRASTGGLAITQTRRQRAREFRAAVHIAMLE